MNVMTTTKGHNMPTWLIDAKRAAERASTVVAPSSTRYGLGVFFTQDETGPTAPLTPEMAGHVAVHAPGARVMTFAEATTDERLGRIVRDRIEGGPRDKEEAVRIAAAEGTIVDVPAGACVDVTVTIPRVRASADHVIIVAGAGSDVHVFERAEGDAERTLRLGRTDIVVGRDATVRTICIADRDDASREIVQREAIVDRGGMMRWTDAMLGGAYVRAHARTALIGERAAVSHRSAFIGTGTQCFDVRQEAVHFASGTTSDIISRGALGDRAKTVYRGLVRMHEGTRAVSGSQKEDTLLLSPLAEIDAMPDLEIATDDVRCGHSASAGRLDAEKVFYLRSRGLSREDAMRMAIKGFFSSVIADAGSTGEMLEREIDARIERLTI